MLSPEAGELTGKQEGGRVTMDAKAMDLQRVRSAEGAIRVRRRPVRRTARPKWLGPVVWTIVLATFITVAGTLPTPHDSVPSRTASAILVTVAPADTLWSIASRHRLPGSSTAETVEAIVLANGMGRRTVSAGATLRVPVLGVSEAGFARSAETVAAR
jgi:Tfp pilus assembly protein FimV